MLKILEAPNNILTTKAVEIKKVDQRIKKIIKEMEKCLLAQKDPLGVGLAAPQVGYSLSLFIMKPHPKAKFEVFVNPRILDSQYRVKKRPEGKKRALEGCLSVPRIWAPVKRASKVLVEYENVAEERKKTWFSDFKAVIVQHEIDHLAGILFSQKALEQKTQLYEEKGGKLKRIAT